MSSHVKTPTAKQNKSINGCDVLDKHCLINALFKKIPISELSKIKERLFDDKVLAIFKDVDLMSSVDELFNNNLNISETSKNAFLHRNTLVYRIDKIYKITGFNLKNFNDAVSFKLMNMIYQSFK